MAVIYSKLGGCLGDTAKLGPLARTDLCAGVEGLLERLITHFVLGSSGEDPWGSLLGGWGVGLLAWELVLLAWEAVLFTWEAWRALCLAEHLGFCLLDLVTWLPAWLVGRKVTCLGRTFPSRGVSSDLAACLGGSTIPGERELPELWLGCYLPLREGECLPGKEGKLLNYLLPWGKGKLPACLPGNCLPELLLYCFLPQEEGKCLPACLSCS